MRRDVDVARRPRPPGVAAVVVVLGALMVGRAWSVYRPSPGRPSVGAVVEDPRKLEERRGYFDEHIRGPGIPLHPAEYWRAVPLPGEEATP